VFGASQVDVVCDGLEQLIELLFATYFLFGELDDQLKADSRRAGGLFLLEKLDCNLLSGSLFGVLLLASFRLDVLLLFGVMMSFGRALLFWLFRFESDSPGGSIVFDAGIRDIGKPLFVLECDKELVEDIIGVVVGLELVISRFYLDRDGGQVDAMLVEVISFSSILLFLNLLVAVAHEVVHLIGGGDVASHPGMTNQSSHRKALSRILLEHLSEEVFQLFGEL